MATILYEKKDKIAYITLNRPEAMNSMNDELRHDLSEAFLAYAEDSDAYVLIVTGAGDKAFCAGRDLKAATQAYSQGKILRSVRPPEPSPLFGTLEIWKPMIAAINGYALGGGLELALACDIRIAADHARMGLSEPKRGLQPGGGGVARLTRAIALGPALEMLFTGDMIDAAEAYRLGLVNRVVPLSGLMPAAEEMARRILDCAPMAVRKIKEMAYRGLEVPLTLALRLEVGPDVRAGEDAKEGPRAFAERRKPVWKNR